MRKKTAFFGLIATALLAGCAAANLPRLRAAVFSESHEVATWTEVATSTEAATSASEPYGHFSLLTYNVAGLPQIISPSTPRANMPLVGRLLDHYDVALVQEDFSYHLELSSEARHPYRSMPIQALSFVGDGLNQFSRFAFGGVHRVRWDRCNGYLGGATDCLADKGFSFSELTLAPGISVHLYNLHADAGRGELDVQTRAHNFQQLAAYIERRSQRHAIIVAGDTNLRTTNPGDAATLVTFVDTLALSDPCPASGCVDDQVDRVLFRSSSTLALSVLRAWRDSRFVDEQQRGLSDHPAIGIDMGWRFDSPTRNAGDPGQAAPAALSAQL
jgi:hypothetical protein